MGEFLSRARQIVASGIAAVALALVFCFATGTALNALPLVLFFVPGVAVWSDGDIPPGARQGALAFGLLLAGVARLALWGLS